MVTNLGGEIVDPISRFGEFWTILYQRAYLQRIGINPYDGEQYDSDDGPMGLGDDNAVDPFDGEPNAVQATRAITGLATTVSTDLNLETMRQQLDEGRVVTAGGTGHRYTVVEIVQDDAGTWLVRLRNPWANDDVHTPNTGSTIDFNAEGLDDGIITVTWDTFSNSSNFANYDFSG